MGREVYKEPSEIETVWADFTEYLKRQHPAVLASLNGPTSEAELRCLEAKVGFALPSEVRQSYLLIHNGQTDDHLGVPGLFHHQAFLSLKAIENEWTVWDELLRGGNFDGDEGEASGPVKPHWWNNKWLPISHDGGGNHICIDMDPAEGGKVGQIIQMYHDDPGRTVIAGSFTDFLRGVLYCMKLGNDEDCRCDYMVPSASPT